MSDQTQGFDIDNDAPKLARDVIHANIGMHLFSMRRSIDDLIKIRLDREYGPLLEAEEGELMALRQSLEFLLSDIRESRVATSRQLLRVVSG